MQGFQISEDVDVDVLAMFASRIDAFSCLTEHCSNVIEAMVEEISDYKVTKTVLQSLQPYTHKTLSLSFPFKITVAASAAVAVRWWSRWRRSPRSSHK